MAIRSDSAIVDVSVRYRVEGLDKSARDVKKASSEFANFAKILKQVGLSLIAFRTVNLLVESFKDLAKSLITVNAQFELAGIQLAVFTGSAEKSRQLINFLTFEATKLAGGLQDLINSATALTTFGIDVQKNLQLVADIAQATGRSVEDVAIAFGRIVAGDPRTKQFLVTRRANLQAFNEALDENKTRLEATRIAFSRFSGVSEKLEGSFGRLTENIGDLGTVMARITGGPAFEKLKKGLQEITDSLRGGIFEGKDIKSGRDSLPVALKAFGLLLSSPSLLFDQGGLGKILDLATEAVIEEGRGLNAGELGAIAGIKLREARIAISNAREIVRLQSVRQLKETRRDFSDAGIKKREENEAAAEQRAFDLIIKLEKNKNDAIFKFDVANDEKERKLKADTIRFLRDQQILSDEESFQRIQEREKRTLAFIDRISGRAASSALFLLFGGDSASIDRQIGKIQEQIDVLDGVTAPLTQQEQLLNRIVELESQRVTFADRLSIVTKQILDDILQAVAKAAILTGVGAATGRGGGFLSNLLGVIGLGVQVASLFTPVGAGVQIVGAIAAGTAAAAAGASSGGIGFRPSEKPVVIMQNPVFLSSDIERISKSAVDSANRRIA